jgi:hypothetical protein
LPTVVLCLWAERPMALAIAAVAFNQSHSFKRVIYSSHGSTVIDEPLGSPENDIQKPVCTWFPWWLGAADLAARGEFGRSGLRVVPLRSDQRTVVMQATVPDHSGTFSLRATRIARLSCVNSLRTLSMRSHHGFSPRRSRRTTRDGGAPVAAGCTTRPSATAGGRKPAAEQWRR